ncbi:MAG: cell division protein FtsL [Xanthomonadaceae bacterium]|nr:cell division protein FtsL [Xanthomonadaceae bacterium]
MNARHYLLLLLVAATIATALAVVQTKHHHRQLFIELTRLERERDELNIDFGRLQLEQATWAETSRIERIARTRLGMRTPEGDTLRVIRP